MGALVFQAELLNNNHIDANELPNGTYFLQADEQESLQKLIINK